MAGEITAAHPAHPIHIIGVNLAGEERGNAAMCNGRTLPWLQDTPQQKAWFKWQAVWRDVIILDEANHRVTKYNLTVHNLARPAAYDSLKTMLLALGQRP